MLPPSPPAGADRTPAFSRRLCRGTKPLRAPRLDKERPTRDLGTALHDALCSDLEEMPVDHGNEGLKLTARVIHCPMIHQLGQDPHKMGINDFAPNVAGIRPPVLWAVQRRRPADVDPWLIPDRWDDQPWPAVYLGRLWELQSAQAVLQRGIVPSLESIRQEQTQRNCLGLGPDPGEGIPRSVAVRLTTNGRGHLGIAQ